MKQIKKIIHLGRILCLIAAWGLGQSPRLHAQADVVLPPGSESNASATASGEPGAAKPPEKQMVTPKVPKNRIEQYYATAFADYFGPSPWVISSTP